MAHILIMPRQGNTVESCIITDIKVKEGDKVNAESIVFEVETDKASFEVPAGASGTILAILAKQGDDIPVLAPIAAIGNPGEDYSAAIKNSSPAEEKEISAKVQKEDSAFSPVIFAAEKNSGGGISPRAKNLAEKEALPADDLSGTGPGGRIIERDVKSALQKRPGLTLAAKSMLPHDIPETGTGLNGRITGNDILQFKNQQPKRTYSMNDEITEIPLKGIRKVISERMMKSLSETAQFTINASAPAAKLLSLRSRIKSWKLLPDKKDFSKITINDLVLYAVSRTLPAFPYMNSHMENGKIKIYKNVHLGFAVDTTRGLLVPVIRNSNLLSLEKISEEAKRLIAACQNGTVKQEELSGSTFSVTNLGSLGVTSFTPVLNLPEVAVLGVCSIETKAISPNPEKPVSINDIKFEPHINFSLTINHQAVDGAPAARFLKTLCDAVSDIDLLLISDLER